MHSVIVITMIVLYWTPTIVAAARNHETASVAVVNGFLGWTIIGWIVALTMSVRQKNQPSRTIYVP